MVLVVSSTGIIRLWDVDARVSRIEVDLRSSQAEGSEVCVEGTHSSE